MEMNSNSRKSKTNASYWIIASIAVLALILSVIVYLQSPKKAGSEVDTRSVTLIDVGFDTPVTLQATCSEDEFNKYLGIVKETFTECNELFDVYHTYDDHISLMEINQNAHDKAIEVDPRIIEVLNEAFKAHEINPKFDVSQGNLIKVWKQQFDAETPALPDPQDIQQAINPDSMNAIKVDGNTIQLTNDQVALDFGAIAKGYTTQLAAQKLEEAGLTSGFINAGGNIVLVGQKVDGSEWRIGVQDPESNGSVLTFITDQATSLVTSGDYQRYMEIDGKRYAHIIDPATGYPSEYMRSVTVINDKSVYCDAMSTALFSVSVEEGLALCEQYELQAIWIVDKGSLDLPADFQTEQFDIYATDQIKDQIQIKQK